MADSYESTKRHQSTVGRRKSRRACEPCRKQKRKCDEQEPCYSCQRYEYHCYYDDSKRKRLCPNIKATTIEKIPSWSKVSSPSTDITIRSGGVVPKELPSDSSSYEPEIARPQPTPTANAFAKRLANVLSNTKATTRSAGQHDSWNLGLRLSTSLDKNLTRLISLEEAQTYASVYFNKVHPIYYFVDHAHFETYIRTRWMDYRATEYDAVVCGVVALGSLFSGSQALRQEIELVELAKTLLDVWSPVRLTALASLDGATAWTLRVLYLRMAMDPHSAWIAARSALIALQGEAEYIRQDADSTTRCAGYDVCNSDADYELHSRLHWAVTALYTWICNEYEPSQNTRGFVAVPCPPPKTSGPNDYLPSLISIFQISLRICNVDRRHSFLELLSILDSVKALPSKSMHDVLQLHKSYHAFCLYRFMRLTSSVVPAATMSLMIRLGKPGLAAALRLAQDHQPWWHIVHIPFQFLCSLLAMDTRESFAEIEGVMATLRGIEHCYVGQTDLMRRVITISEGLVRMCHKRKTEAADLLARSHQVPVSTLSTAHGCPVTGDLPGTAPLLLPSTEAIIDFAPFDLESFEWEDFTC